MSATPPREYENIEVTGPVSVDRVNGLKAEDIAPVRNFWTILIMGPTGAGKSTFIETLGLRRGESISSNQLQGFTQTVSTYRVNGCTSDSYPIYLVDSPGFADTKISEMAIVTMLQKWLKDSGIKYYNRILYLTPITQVRLPGSQRQILKTLQALTGAETAGSINIVTTMWDMIWGDRATTRAEETHKQLEGDIWKDFIDEGASIFKFHNTQESALSVLDEALRDGSAKPFHVEDTTGTDLRETPFAANLYTDLHNRIRNLQSEIATIQSDLEHAKAQGDQQLQSVLRRQLNEAEKYLKKFRGELQDFGPAPNISQHVPPTSGLVEPAAAPAQVDSGLPPFPKRPATPEGQEPHRPPRGQLFRALNLITECGCCGKGVAANYDT